MKSVILSLLLLAMIPSSKAQEQDIYLPLNTICNENQVVLNAIKDYKEMPFAQGTGMIFGAKDNQRYPGIVKIYLSNTGSFTITIEIDPGIECVITSGLDFNPVVPIDSMH